jgi:hypothetical protein
MINSFKALQELVLSLEADFDKWATQSNQAAATRLRKAMQELKQQASQIRQDVQASKKAESVTRKQGKALPSPLASKLAVTKPKEAGFYQFEADNFTRVFGPVSYNGQTVNTRFTDAQAVNICGKMADAYARAVALKYQEFSSHVQGSVYRYQLHYLANKALTMYGGPVLTFLAGLRPLKFNNLTAALAVKRFRLLREFAATEVDFPTLTFQTVGGNEYTMAFHLAESVDKRRKPVQIFRNRVKVGSIDSYGAAFDAQGKAFARAQTVKPSLLIFCDYLQRSKSPSFYSGVETGSCFVCGRPLTDPRSLRYGIGPTCLSRSA